MSCIGKPTKLCDLELLDDEQAAVLFSLFRDKSLNPHSWNRKMKFWENLLLQTALEQRTVSFSVDSLPVLFERKGIKPRCLGTVVEEMRKSGQIKTVKDYQKSDGWLTWGLNALVKQPLSWAVSNVWSSSKEPTVFVWPQVVRKLCGDVLSLPRTSIHSELTGDLISLAQFRAACQALVSSDQDFNIVLRQLEADRKIVFGKTQDQEVVVKLCKAGESSVSPIKETDLQVFKIQSTLLKLEEDIEVLSSRAKLQETAARAHVREGNTTMAKHCLRRKKAILRTVDKRSGSLTILHNILQSIEEAKTNEMVVRACEAGNAAMKNLNSDLNLDKAEAVMLDTKEAIENIEDINEVLGSLGAEEDRDELEQDLELLLRDTDSQSSPVKQSRPGTLVSGIGEWDELLNELPSVPTHSPSISRPEAARSDISRSYKSLPS